MPLLEENDYLIDFDAIDPEIARKAKMMIVSYPNNPTCAIAPDSFYEKLIAFAKKYEIIVLHDNAYSELVFDGKIGKSFLSFDGAKDIGIELNSFSKTFGMAGARLGVMVGNKEIIRVYNTLKSNMDYGIFLPVQYAGIEALRHGGKGIKSTCQAYQDRRDLLMKEFKKAGWMIPKSPATMFAWARIPESYKDSLDFTVDLLEKTGIVVTPGQAFGQQGKRYVRLALVQDKEAIIEAGQRIALYFPVSRSIHFVVAYGRSCIAVQTYGFQTADLPASSQIGFYLQQDYAIGIRLCPKRQPANAKRLDFKPPTGHLRQCNE